nr:hypothetical protein [Tanacetum cinerariifolium]
MGHFSKITWHLFSSAGETFFTSSENFFWQWELITGSGNALSILFPTILTLAENPVKEILLKLNLPDRKSILIDSQVTPTKHGRMTKPYSSYHFIANCFNARHLKMEVKDSLVVAILKSEGSGYRMETIRVEYEWKPPRSEGRKQKDAQDDGFQSVKWKASKGGNWKKTASTLVSNAFSTLEKDNGKPMNALVDDTWKKVEALTKKTLYLDWDDMEFDDVGHAVEEVKHGNTYSENG